MIVGRHGFTPLERVVYGRPAAEVVAEEIEHSRHQRVFVVTNRSLSDTPALEGIARALGSRCAGRYAAVRAHSPRECVLEGAVAARAAKADVLLAVGGGSVIDAAKGMLLCLRHGYTETAQLDPHANDRCAEPTRRPPDEAQWLRCIAVPTTLSAAEFTWVAGITDTARRAKQGFGHPMMIPRTVVLDPAMTLMTPPELMFSTGVKAIDHAVEQMIAPQRNAYADAVSAAALRLLASALPMAKAHPTDLAPRSELQYGMFLSLAGLAAGARPGLSHAIGHALGGHSQMAHGDTSCVALPAVLQWTRNHCADRQAIVADAMGRPGEEAGHVVGELVSLLGRPRRLRDAGVSRESFGPIARHALRDPLIVNSPRPVSGELDILEVLDLAE